MIHNQWSCVSHQTVDMYFLPKQMLFKLPWKNAFAAIPKSFGKSLMLSFNFESHAAPLSPMS